MKKEYIEPQIEVLTMTTLQMLAFSWILSGDPMNFFTNQ